MKLYVGTYGKYNSGSIEGAWLDLNDYADKDEFIEACLELHKDEHDPELMFQDYEADNQLEKQFYGESYISERYWEYKDALDNCGLDADVVAEYIMQVGYDDVIEGIEKASENYCGTWNSLEEWAEDEVEQGGYLDKDLPSWITCHIDYSGIARDLSYDYNVVETDNGVSIFTAY